MHIKKIIILSCFYLLINSCNKPGINDPLEGYTAFDPKVHFYKYYLKDYGSLGKVPDMHAIDTLHQGDTLTFYVSESNRSDGKPCPAPGNSLKFAIETASGDKETFYLDDDSGFIAHPDNSKPYIKFLNYTIGSNINYPIQNNHIIEINKNGDKTIATYWSYWNQHIVKDTLFF